MAAALTWRPRDDTVELVTRQYVRQSIQAGDTVEWLKELRQRWPDESLLVIWDGASIHKGKLLRQLEAEDPGLSILPLPPYAPELMPVEPLWALEKYDRHANHCWCDADEIDRTLQADLAELAGDDSLLRRLIGKPNLAWCNQTLDA